MAFSAEPTRTARSKHDLRHIFDDVPSYGDLARVRLGGRPGDPVRVPDLGRPYRRGDYIFRYEGDDLIIESAHPSDGD